MITREQLVKVLSNNGRQVIRDGLIDGLLKTMDKYGISENDSRIAMFIAQTAHESGGFKYLIESLNMSAKRICQVWPSRFPNEVSAAPYAYNPPKLANKVYSNRMGNGDEASGEGFKYRGRGVIQLTGKDNYTAFARSLKIPLENVPGFLETDEGACESAGWFWNARKLNVYSDNEDIETVTRKINGGTIGLKERTMLFDNFKTKLMKIREEEKVIIPEPVVQPEPTPTPPPKVEDGETTF